MRTLDTDVGPVHVVSTLADARECWDWLTPYRLQGALLAWDGETTEGSISPWDSRFRLRTAQISDGKVAWVIQAEKPDMTKVVREITRAHPRWLAHFAENDIRFAERGVPGSVRLNSVEPHFICSQVALAWYDVRTVTSQKYGSISLPRALKPSVSRILETDVLTTAEDAMKARFRELAPKGHRTSEKCKAWGFSNIDIDDETYLRYGGLDALMEYRLFERCYSKVVKRGKKEGLDLDLFLQWHIDLMTFRGMSVDDTYVHWLDQELEQVILDRMTLMCEHKVALSGQGQSVGAAFEKLGCRSTRTTKTGNPSWDSAMLQIIINHETEAQTEEHKKAVELAKAIQLLRKSGKFRAAYVRPMLLAGKLDNRLHCSMRCLGTSTSRWSAERPALQQLPKRHDKRIRAAFTARPPAVLPAWLTPYLSEPWVFVSGDYSKGEPRVMAAKSGDLDLQRDLEDGNFYANVAKRTYGNLFNPDEIEDPAKPGHQMYQNCKNGYMAHAYGCGDEKEAQLLGTSVEEAKDVKGRWTKAYKRLAAYARKLNNQKSVTLTSGWVAPLWDRYFINAKGQPECGKRPSRNGLCYDTQGDLAVILRGAARRVIDKGWSWALALFIHDEIVLCVPQSLAEAARDLLNECMPTVFYGFPMHCDVKICGPTWVSREGFGYDATHDVTQLILGTDENDRS